MQHLQSLPPRNSNLRELPIAPSNNNPIRPLHPRPMTKFPQNARSGAGGGAAGQGWGLTKTAPTPGAFQTKNETPASQTSTPVQKITASTPAQVNTSTQLAPIRAHIYNNFIFNLKIYYLLVNAAKLTCASKHNLNMSVPFHCVNLLKCYT